MLKKFKNSLGRVIVASLILIGASSGAARAGMVNFSLMGGIDDTVNNGGSLGFLGGAGLNFGLVPMVHLEVDGLYLSRAFSGFSNVNWIEVPVVFRFRLLPLFSVGVGGFYDFAVTSGAGSNDGIVTSARLRLPGSPIYIDGRFNIGLTQFNGSGMNDFQLMLGVMF